MPIQNTLQNILQNTFKHTRLRRNDFEKSCGAKKFNKNAGGESERWPGTRDLNLVVPQSDSGNELIPLVAECLE